MVTKYSSLITATLAGVALLAGGAVKPAQAQEGPTQGPNAAPNIQNLDPNQTNTERPSEAPDTLNQRSTQRARALPQRSDVGNAFFVRGDRSSILIQRGPNGAFFPVSQAGFGGPDLSGSSDYPKLEVKGPNLAPRIVD